ncbi:MAG: beta-propeller domain-containing protein [Xanthomonadales bacterium]|nr:beta-propeller domain-containing protein [Xanthomonadales bacterium]
MLIALCLTACAADPARKISVAYRQLVAPPARVIDDGESMRVHLEQRRALRQLQARLRPAADDADDVEVLFAVQVTGSRIGSVSITNTQEAGVDEGGLIKFAQGHLVVLRDGWLFVIDTGPEAAPQLRVTDAINLRDQPESDDVWFDELITHGSLLTVLGFDYSSFDSSRSDVRSFSLQTDGRVVPLTRIQLRSDDYFSSDGYGMRIRGEELLLQLRRWLGDGGRPNWPEWQPYGSGEEWRPLVDLARVYIPDFLAETDVLHSYLSCDLGAFAAGRFECQALSVLGGSKVEPYYTDEALYLGFGHPDERRFTDRDLARLPSWEVNSAAPELARTTVLRIPMSPEGSITSVRLLGKLWSGFDFKLINDRLHVATSWNEETLHYGLTREAFSLGGRRLQEVTGSLPDTSRKRRFSEHALWMVSDSARGFQDALWMLPLEGTSAQSSDLPCCAEILQPVADNMIVLGDFGCWSDSEHVWLHAFGKDLKQRAVIDHPGRCLPESRAQAINFAAQPEGESIVMVWPTAEVIRSPTVERSIAMHFLLLAGDQVKETGVVPMDDGPAPVPTESNDWYGNTRTVIIGERIFLLSGDLLKEVRHSASGVREVGRVALPRQTDD